MRVIFFDVDGTLLDDETAIARGLDALHVSYGATLGLGRDALGHQWQQSLERHFPRFLAGEISMDEQRRARMRDLFGSVTTAERCDEATDATDERLRINRRILLVLECSLLHQGSEVVSPLVFAVRHRHRFFDGGEGQPLPSGRSQQRA